MKYIHAIRTFFRPKNRLLIAGGIFLALVALFVARGKAIPPPQLITVIKGSVVEEVSVTGKTKPREQVDLAFDRGGRIRSVTVLIGDKAYEGQTLVSLDQNELSAQRLEAVSNGDVQKAKLDELSRGTRPEDIQIKRTELKKAEQDLANYYANVADIVNDAYSKTDDAIRKQLDDLFVNDESSGPKLSYTTSDNQAEIDATSGRASATIELNAWKGELATLTTTNTPSVLEDALTKVASRLAAMRTFLIHLNDTLTIASSVSGNTLQTYKADITTAKSSLNTAITNVNTQAQTIASQKITVAKIQDELNLKLAGNTPENIAAQSATVKQAEAQLALIDAQLSHTVIRAPFAGTVTKVDAKAGEIAGVNVPLIAIISEHNLEIEANVPEVDIGKIAKNNPVRISFDAFPGEHIQGTVTFIDPAETIVDGVVNFKVTIALAKDDPRVKSGLTANLAIETVHREGVLVIPQYAILENDRGTFVRRVRGKMTEEISVILGIRGAGGMVEITQGLQEGDKLENIGIKSQ